jgi:hypothetical protein
MREEHFQEVCESEGLSIRGPDQPRENGWVYEPDRQRALLSHFWGKLERGKSLVFYYCNQGNPLDEKASRIIVGIGRIAEVGPQLYFGTNKKYQDQYPIWSRRITQDYPNQGVRLPYQEYIRQNLPTDKIICRVPRNAILPFSFGGEHVSDGDAVTILEAAIQCLDQVCQDKFVQGDWDARLTWLNDVLAEVWSGRGPFPGLGSVLQYLGFSQGTAYQRMVLAGMAKRRLNAWEHVLAILTGKVEPEDGPYKAGLLKARQRWSIVKTRHKLLATLARIELSPDQVERIANPEIRTSSGIAATEEELVANPYVIAEMDLGTSDSDAVALETIDQAMLPQGDAALFPSDDRVAPDDRRRVRAVAKDVLRSAAENGDTVLTFSDLMARIHRRFPEKRACRPDGEVIQAEAEFHREVLWMAFDHDPPLAALKTLRQLETHIVQVVERRAGKTNPSPRSVPNWRKALESSFGKPRTEREEAALREKEKALAILFSRRVSVLVGAAGKGKTSVLRVFLEQLDKIEGRQATILLAPTGKARVRLATKTGRMAMTIHQFLLKQEWLTPDVFSLKAESRKEPYKTSVVIIDECSMIPTDLLGTLFKALDTGPLTRLILVGDPNQLPPIGPGRPFVDLIEWLKDKHLDCLAPLTTCMRTDEDEEKPTEESLALALAEGYRASSTNPGDDEILAAVARGDSRGDLEVVFWNDHDDLLRKLEDTMAANLGVKPGDYVSLNKSLGIDTKNWTQSESWQILSPTRTQHFGTDDLNRLIQLDFKKGLIVMAQNRGSRMPRPFGDQEIVATDKVIQIRNKSIKAWPREVGLDYVANGEIGIVRNTTKGSKTEYLDVVFSTQPEVSYRYFRSQVDENLELAYALTVHKAQGSDFTTVFLIIPRAASTLSRELLYTGLTRFRRKLVLLIERDITALLALRSPQSSETRLRNTQMFALILRPEELPRPHLERLIHRTRRGIAVRSKSEVVVADVLESLGISYQYEEPLYSRTDPKDFRLPDFTVSFEGDTYYWEHLGMMSVPAYRQAWDRKLAWYRSNDYVGQLIVSEDGADGSIDASKIEVLARERVLGS